MDIDGGAAGEEGNEDVLFVFDENDLQWDAHAAEVDAEAPASQVVVQADDTIAVVSSPKKKLQTAIAKDQLYRETEVYACIYPHVALLKEQDVVKFVESAQLQSETDWINIVRHCY